MSIDEAQRRVAHIIAICRGDPEGAHDLEDRLHVEVLREIAKHSVCGYARVLAREALASRDIDFPRWPA